MQVCCNGHFRGHKLIYPIDGDDSGEDSGDEHDRREEDEDEDEVFGEEEAASGF